MYNMLVITTKEKNEAGKGENTVSMCKDGVQF